MKDKPLTSQIRRAKSDRSKRHIGKRSANTSPQRDRCVSPHLPSTGPIAADYMDSPKILRIHSERPSRALSPGPPSLQRSNTLASTPRTVNWTPCPPPPFLSQEGPSVFVFPPNVRLSDEACASSSTPPSATSFMSTFLPTNSSTASASVTSPLASPTLVLTSVDKSRRPSLPEKSTVTSTSASTSMTPFGSPDSPADSVFPEEKSLKGSETCKAVYARALYRNEAENKRELSFQRGDTLTVLEQDVAGLTGWWLCTLRGQTGIVPGNRLKLLSQEHVRLEPIPKPGSRSGASTPTNKNTDWRAMWQARSRVVTPRRQGDLYVYDQRNSTGSQQSTGSDYDVPPQPVKVADTGGQRNGLNNSHSAHTLPVPTIQTTYDTPSRSSRASLEDLYDVPKSDHSESNRSSTFSMVSSLSSASNVSPAHDSSLDNSLYDVPPSRRSRSLTSSSNHTNSFTSDLSELYDTPAKIVNVVSPFKRSLEKLVDGDETDFKKDNGDIYQEPDYVQIPDDFQPSAKACAVMELYDKPPLQNEKRELPQTVYDIPPQVTRDAPPPPMRKSSSAGSMDNLEVRMKHLSSSSQDSRCSDIPTVNYDPLPLELDAAMDKFTKLQQDLQSSTSRLLGFVSSTWRQRQNLEVHVYSIKMACNAFQNGLREFLEFSQGALANSASASDKNLCQKLHKALIPLQAAVKNLDEYMSSLDFIKWDVSQLVLEPKQGVLNKKVDSLGAIVALAQDLLSDMRLVVSIVQANSSLLFRQKKEELKLPDGRVIDRHLSVPLPSPPKEEDEVVPSPDDKKDSSSDYENDSKEWMDGYDYCRMQKKNSRKKNHNNDKLENSVKLPPADKQLLVFYSAQVQNQSVMLNDSIDTFLACIEQNQPPKVFVANSKFVVLNAHKMVYIGDTLHRNLLQTDVRTNIMHGANNLCEMLKRALAVTKTAALQYPAIVAIQDMVDRVVDVSNCAHQLKLVITTAAQLDVINS